MFQQLRNLVFFGFGAIGIIAFHAGLYFPEWLSVAIVGAGVLAVWRDFARGATGVLTPLAGVVLVVPFIHVVPYIWFDYAAPPPATLWGLRVNPYMTDERVIRLTGMLGAVAACGFMVGSGLSFSKHRPAIASRTRSGEVCMTSLSMPIWLAWIAAGALLSWIATPVETLLEADYTKASSRFSGLGFDSAYLLSYLVFSICFGDALVDSSRTRRRAKEIIFAAILAYVTIWLQLLRGDRAVLPLVGGVATAAAWWYPMSRGDCQAAKRGIFNLGAIALTVLLVSNVVSLLRVQLAGVASWSDIPGRLAIALDDARGAGADHMEIAMHGTWTGALLTPLSVAGDHVHGLLQPKLGADYWNLLISVPPGFVCEAIGFERPIDALHGPAWEMTYGLGGTHAVVLPFRNWLMAGVFTVTLMWSYLLGPLERSCLRRRDALGLSSLCASVAVAPTWLWYGEKPLITALIAWLCLSNAYRLLQGRGGRGTTSQYARHRQGLSNDFA